MSAIATTKSWISDCLRTAGLRGRGSVWRLIGKEVQWVVHIDELPYGDRLGIDIGLDLQVASTPRRPTDCPVLLHLENLAVTKKFAVIALLNIDSSLTPDRRHQELEGVMRALTAYLTDHLTLRAVRAAYRDGDFDSAFIHKNARATLEAGGDTGL